MIAEAEAEMCALETSIDTYSEMSAMENPPNNLVDFANEVDSLHQFFIRQLFFR